MVRTNFAQSIRGLIYCSGSVEEFFLFPGFALILCHKRGHLDGILRLTSKDVGCDYGKTPGGASTATANTGPWVTEAVGLALPAEGHFQIFTQKLRVPGSNSGDSNGGNYALRPYRASPSP